MINQNILAIGWMAFASATGAAGQTLDDRAIQLVVEVQSAIGTKGEEKRDHLVEAAYLARRIVEDTPDNLTAELLRGSGIEVFGSEPIRYEALQEAMMDACIEVPDALCLVDMAYVIGVRSTQMYVEDMLKKGQNEFIDSMVADGGRLKFRSEAAIAYSELRLVDRVRETANYNAERGLEYYEPEYFYGNSGFAYSLARIGDLEAAEKLSERMVVQANANPNSWYGDLVTINGIASYALAAAGALNTGNSKDFDRLIAEGSYHAENLVGGDFSNLINGLTSAFSWSRNLELIEAAEDVFLKCSEPEEKQRCAHEMAIAYAMSGRIEEAFALAAVDPTSVEKSEIVALAVEAGYTDIVRKHYFSELKFPEQVVALWTDRDLLPIIICIAHYRLGDKDEARRIAEMKSGHRISTFLTEALPILEAYRLMDEGLLSEAIAVLQRDSADLLPRWGVKFMYPYMVNRVANDLAKHVVHDEHR